MVKKLILLTSWSFHIAGLITIIAFTVSSRVQELFSHSTPFSILLLISPISLVGVIIYGFKKLSPIRRKHPYIHLVIAQVSALLLFFRIPATGSIVSNPFEPDFTISIILVIIIIAAGLVLPFLARLYFAIRGKITFKQFIGRILISGIISVVILLIVPSASGFIINSFLVSKYFSLEIVNPENELLNADNLIISENSQTLLDCYLKENSSLFLSALKIYAGKSIMLVPRSDMAYFKNPHCTIIIISYRREDSGIDLDKSLQKRAILAETLIRKLYLDKIEDKNQHPYLLVNLVEKDSDYYKGHSRGYYQASNNLIAISAEAFSSTIKGNFNIPLDIFVHEELHAFASRDRLGPGLEEAITAYLTDKVLNEFSGKKTWGYRPQQEALLELAKYISIDDLVRRYFQGSFPYFAETLDSQTYPGALCTFNYYLDSSVTAWTDERDYDKSKKLAENAKLALSDPQLAVEEKCYSNTLEY